MIILHNLNHLRERRRELRSRSTAAEDMLWQALRNNNLGLKFRRQHSVGGYVLDFYCAKKRLLIELDGPIHNFKSQKEYDEQREDFFKGLDYTIVRFKNDEVENHLEEVLGKIRQMLGSTLS